MLRSMIIAAALLTTASCSKANEELDKLAEKACACKDAECANKAIEDFAKFIKENKDARGDEDRAAKAAEKFSGCVMEKGGDVQKLMDAANSIK